MATAPIHRAVLHDLYRAGISPVEIVDDVLARIESADDAGIFLHVEPPGRLRERARRLPPFDPARYPLWGLPFAIKDNIDLAGVPTTAACPAYAYVPRQSATVVERLVAAGALPIGKTNLDQFATGLVGVRTPHAVPRNAFDPTRVPGGSSSGSAVAVAMHLVTFSLGTDTAGSGRIPAALNNIVGLKPSVGLLSGRGVVPACRTLDCVSVFAATVADAQTVLDCAAGFDENDAYSRHITPHEQALERIGVPRADDLFFFGDIGAASAWQAAVGALPPCGVETLPIDMSAFFAVARLLYEGPWVAERRAAVGRFMDEQPHALHPVTRSILDSASQYTAVDTFNAMYRLADLRRAAEEVFAPFDALAVPTAPIFPTLADLAADPIGPNSRLGTYTNFVNLLDLAAIAVPGPFRADGLPAGLTLIGRAGSDHALARLAARYFPATGGFPADRTAGKES
ncbi:MAG: allophanate hydrolase [Hyphomicrobiaceae bacterium]|nr:allophanate hydrolase [Hyphomicrobiaceae bacterium]